MKRKSNGKKNTNTIDSLAIMVARGFAGVDKKFEEVDKKLDVMDKKIENLDDGIKATRRDILDMGDRFVGRFEFDNLALRFSRLEQKVRTKIK